ncbi:hypothetical protein B0H21DRAFT_363719 [Amylocystis lapponica]|nr:hypothetical protein B0H21DRAFT_363719 [Amylocystis lapponica]
MRANSSESEDTSSETTPDSQTPIIRRHETFYFADEPVIFQRTPFQSASALPPQLERVRRDVLPPPRGRHGRGGRCDEHPIHLQGILSIDFERFSAFSTPTVAPHRKIGTDDLSTVDDWASVLAIATRFAFDDCRAHAISRLAQLGNPVDLILIGRKYDVREWLGPSYKTLCIRNEPLTMLEGTRLGMRDVILISEIRQGIRGNQIAVQERSVMLLINGKLV